jgi:hypothetical protein
MPEGRTHRLQRALAALVLAPDEASQVADPACAARNQALPGMDQAAFRDQAEALLTYRELARMSLIEPLEEMFPILKSLLERVGTWESCVQSFLEARVIRSGHYRDIAPAFLGWLAATRWGQDRWPFLLELAHAEILEVLVARYPDSSPPVNLHPDPGPEDLLVLDPATQVVSYRHAVHQVDESSPLPEARPTHLLAFRDQEGGARLLELTPATAALLVRAQTASLTEAAEALGLGLEATFDLLQNLQRDGAVAGFQPAT